MTDLTDTIKELRAKCFDTPMDGITWPIASSKLLPILDAAENAERYEKALLYIASGCLVPPDGGAPCLRDAIKKAKQALAPEPEKENGE